MKEKKKDLHLMVEEKYHTSIKAAAAVCRVSISDYCLNLILKGSVTPFSKMEQELSHQVQEANEVNHSTFDHTRK